MDFEMNNLIEERERRASDSVLLLGVGIPTVLSSLVSLVMLLASPSYKGRRETSQRTKRSPKSAGHGVRTWKNR